MVGLGRYKDAGAKRKGKAGIFTESFLDKSTSSPSLEALLSDPSLYEEIPLDVLDEGAFSSLGDLFDEEVV